MVLTVVLIAIVGLAMLGLPLVGHPIGNVSNLNEGAWKSWGHIGWG
jgi:hypothetical protein